LVLYVLSFALNQELLIVTIEKQYGKKVIMNQHLLLSLSTRSEGVSNYIYVTLSNSLEKSKWIFNLSIYLHESSNNRLTWNEKLIKLVEALKNV
jgi:hypothetical protein